MLLLLLFAVVVVTNVSQISWVQCGEVRRAGNDKFYGVCSCAYGKKATSHQQNHTENPCKLTTTATTNPSSRPRPGPDQILTVTLQVRSYEPVMNLSPDLLKAQFVKGRMCALSICRRPVRFRAGWKLVSVGEQNFHENSGIVHMDDGPRELGNEHESSHTPPAHKIQTTRPIACATKMHSRRRDNRKFSIRTLGSLFF